MLSSVQDYRAGLPGLQEHIWGVTLGRELQVFVTHPANSDTGSSARPNAWAGHRILPRVHQHRNALIHLQRFTTTDPIRSTHLWLPQSQTDEYIQQGEWIAARRGEGYVAIATPGGVRPVLEGETAWQEWLPVEGGAAWITVVGRKQADGDFRDWINSLASSEVQWHPRGEADPGVRFERDNAPVMEVTFETAFLLDGTPVGLVNGVPENEPHLDNPAVHAEFDDGRIDVAWRGKTLGLDVGGSLSALAEAYAVDSVSSPTKLVGSMSNGR
jgi:hypothetical protein